MNVFCVRRPTPFCPSKGKLHLWRGAEETMCPWSLTSVSNCNVEGTSSTSFLFPDLFTSLNWEALQWPEAQGVHRSLALVKTNLQSPLAGVTPKERLAAGSFPTAGLNNDEVRARVYNPTHENFAWLNRLLNTVKFTRLCINHSKKVWIIRKTRFDTRGVGKALLTQIYSSVLADF